VYRAVMLASQANAPVYITKVMSRSSADVIADSRRTGEIDRCAVLFTHSRVGFKGWCGSHAPPPLVMCPFNALSNRICVD